MSRGSSLEEGIWLQALQRVTFVPEEHREFDVGTDTALDMLRCDPETLDALVSGGLPTETNGDSRRFCRFDLFNLALYSGSGSSLPEIGLEFAFRFTRRSKSDWTAEKPLRLSSKLRCSLAQCEDSPAWGLSRPVPEIFGGYVQDISSQAGPVDISSRNIQVFGEPGDVAICVDVTTAGRRDRIVSPKLSELFYDFLNSGLQWQLLPSTWQTNPSAVLEHGIVNCIAAAIHLERMARDLGYEAYARRGWLVGLMDLDHAWLEVEDDDGQRKAVDVVLALLARLLPGDRAEFAQFCIGSSMNRVLPATARAEEPLGFHVCGGTRRKPDLSSSIKPRRRDEA